MGEGHCKVSHLFFRISDTEIALNYRNPKNYSRKIHDQFTAIAFSPYGRRTSFYVHKRGRNREILALFPPNPQGGRKERSHGRLEKSKALARNREPMTICHENEEVYTSDFNTM